MHIFRSNIDLEKNELLNLKLGNQIDFPSVTASDAGYVFFHSGLSIFYGYDGASWIDLGKELGASTVWRKSDLLTPADSYTEQIHHQGKVVLNGAPLDAAYSTATGSLVVVGTLGIQGTTIQSENTTSWLTIKGNQGLRLEQVNGNVGYIQIGNDSSGTMAATQVGDYNTKISRSWTISQSTDPDFKNIYSAGAVNYSGVTSGTRTFTSLYIAPTALTNVTTHVGINTNGLIRLRDYNTDVTTETATRNLAVGANGWVVTTDLASLSKYAVTIGDTTTTEFTINHALGTNDVIVQVVNLLTDEYVDTVTETVDTNNVKVTFATAPYTNEFRVIVIG